MDHHTNYVIHGYCDKPGWYGDPRLIHGSHRASMDTLIGRASKEVWYSKVDTWMIMMPTMAVHA